MTASRPSTRSTARTGPSPAPARRTGTSLWHALRQRHHQRPRHRQCRRHARRHRHDRQCHRQWRRAGAGQFDRHPQRREQPDILGGFELHGRDLGASSDLTRVTGIATLGGATVVVVPIGTVAKQYTILTATGGVLRHVQPGVSGVFAKPEPDPQLRHQQRLSELRAELSAAASTSISRTSPTR